jgi:hypothetical protein
MFWDKCTIFRENKMPVLKPVVNDKLLFTRFFLFIYLKYIL